MSLSPREAATLLGFIEPASARDNNELRKMHDEASRLIEIAFGNEFLSHPPYQMVRTVDEWDCPITVVKPGIGSVHPAMLASTLTIQPSLWSNLNELSTMHLVPPMPELGVTINDLDGDTLIISDRLYPNSEGYSLVLEQDLPFKGVHLVSPMYSVRTKRTITHHPLQQSISKVISAPAVKYPDVIVDCQPDVRWVQDMKGNFNNTKALLRKGITIKPNLIGK